MKVTHFFRSICLAGALAGAVPASVVAGTPTDSVQYTVSLGSHNKQALVVLNKLGGQHVNISVQNQVGDVLYSRTVEGKYNVLQRLDLRHLAEGAYTISVATEGKLRQQNLLIAHNGIELTERSFVATPGAFSFRIKDSMMHLFAENYSNSAVEVQLTDSKGNEVYSGAFNSPQHFARTFDLHKLKAGDYNLQVIAANTTYTRSFAIN